MLGEYLSRLAPCDPRSWCSGHNCCWPGSRAAAVPDLARAAPGSAPCRMRSSVPVKTTALPAGPGSCLRGRTAFDPGRSGACPSSGPCPPRSSTLIPDRLPLANTQAQVCVSVQPRNRLAGLSVGRPALSSGRSGTRRGAKAGGELSLRVSACRPRGRPGWQAAGAPRRRPVTSPRTANVGMIRAFPGQRASRSMPVARPAAGVHGRAAEQGSQGLDSAPRAGVTSSAPARTRAPATSRGDRCRCSRSSSPRRSGRPSARSWSGRGWTGSRRSCRSGPGSRSASPWAAPAARPGGNSSASRSRRRGPRAGSRAAVGEGRRS